MYNTTTKPSRGGIARRSFSSGRTQKTGYGTSRSNYGSGGNFKRRFSNGRNNGPQKQNIREEMFVNKAEENVSEQYIAKNKFTDFSIPPKLSENLKYKGLNDPSPIQDQAIPVALKGSDIIGIAGTGTGKTAAFLIPIINKLVNNPNEKAIILAPTRELATQVQKEFYDFTRGMKLFSVACVGGSPIYPQIRELERGVSVIVGTPGRVMDLIERGKINMKTITSVVLDEADRMLDMGFIHDMRSILGKIEVPHQTFFFSATFSPEIKRLTSEFLKDPINISVKTRDTSCSVEQNVIRAERGKKVEVLHDILNKPECKKVLIFREMKRSVDELGSDLRNRGFKVMCLHGDMRTRERERAVKSFTAGTIQIVVATDVAARGIDIPDITHVINFDKPSTYDTYIHRIGRTGRGNKKGNALTFV